MTIKPAKTTKKPLIAAPKKPKQAKKTKKPKAGKTKPGQPISIKCAFCGKLDMNVSHKTLLPYCHAASVVISTKAVLTRERKCSDAVRITDPEIIDGREKLLRWLDQGYIHMSQEWTGGTGRKR